MRGVNRRLRPHGVLCVCLAMGLVAIPTESADAQMFGEGFWKKKKQVRSYRHYNRHAARPYYRRKVRRSRNRIRKKATVPAVQLDKSIKGPVQLVVSLPDQRVTVYKGGKPIASSRVSTGKRGHRTPSGIFSIIQKNRRHYSNIYRGAPMPYMQRITWSGIALHAGVVPGYPASHGCIRLPKPFARSLFSYTNKGAHVVVAREAAKPTEISHVILFQPTAASEIMGSPAVVEPSQSGGVAGASATPAVVLTSADASEPSAVTHLRTSVAAKTEVETPVSDSAKSAALGLLDLEAHVGRMIAYQDRSEAPLRILVTRRKGKERQKTMQRLLTELGFDTGPVDGWIGKQTIAAIKSFQESRGLRPTGMVTDSLYSELFEATGRTDHQMGHLYVRQGFKDVFDTPVKIKDPDSPLGTHLYTAMHFEKGADKTAWTALTVTSRPRAEGESRRSESQSSIPPVVITAGEALDRITIPEHVRRRISDMLTPGSSLVVSDHGISGETGRGTDFVVLTR